MPDDPHHSDHPKYGYYLGVAGVGGVGITLMSSPDLFWLGAAVCFVCATFTIIRYLPNGRIFKSQFRSKSFHLEFSVVVLCLLVELCLPLYMVCLRIYSFEDAKKSAVTQNDTYKDYSQSELMEIEKPLSLRDLFETDFPIGIYNTWTNTISPNESEAPGHCTFYLRTLYDLSSQSKFYSVYVPDCMFPFDIAKLVLQKMDIIISSAGQPNWRINVPGQSAPITGKSFVFSKTIYFYFENKLSFKEKAEIEDAFDLIGVKLYIRDDYWLLARQSEPSIISAVRKIRREKIDFTKMTNLPSSSPAPQSPQERMWPQTFP